jgi:hypothetical protein
MSLHSLIYLISDDARQDHKMLCGSCDVCSCFKRSSSYRSRWVALYSVSSCSTVNVFFSQGCQLRKQKQCPSRKADVEIKCVVIESILCHGINEQEWYILKQGINMTNIVTTFWLDKHRWELWVCFFAANFTIPENLHLSEFCEITFRSN